MLQIVHKLGMVEKDIDTESAEWVVYLEFDRWLCENLHDEYDEFDEIVIDCSHRLFEFCCARFNYCWSGSAGGADAPGAAATSSGGADGPEAAALRHEGANASGGKPPLSPPASHLHEPPSLDLSAQRGWAIEGESKTLLFFIR